MPQADGSAPAGPATASRTSAPKTTPSLRSGSIARRLVLLVVVLVGFTTVAIGTLAYQGARRALAEAADTRLELLARDLARDLHRELSDRASDIMTWARLETMIALTFGDVDQELAEILRQAQAARSVYLALAALDREGGEVATAGAVWHPESGLPADATPVLRVVPWGAASALELAVPVVHPRRPGERIGTLVALLDPVALLAVRAEDETAVNVTLGAPGATLAVTPGPPDAGHAFEKAAPLPRLPGLEAPRLAVTVRQPERVALARIYALRATLTEVAVTVLLLSALAGALVAWRLSTPIRQLTTAVETITSHGRPEPLGALPDAMGEVGVLAKAFEAMMARLAAAQEEAIAQSRLALLGEIAASLAHDVRTPLSVLKTSAQLIASGDLPAAEQERLARTVAAEVDRLNGVVTNLVDLARPRASARTLEPVADLVARAAGVLGPWARARGITLDTAGAAVGLRVRCDRDQMQQVLVNLVHNAVQATRAPGRVVLRARPDDGAAHIEVADSGPGFSPDALARAFSPFFTTRADGTGLGLAIVKRIVEEHGGQVGARNAPEGGAIVWCRLPLRETAA